MHRIYLLGVSSLALALCSTACTDDDAVSSAHAGSAGTVASAGSSNAGENQGGAAGNAETEAGAAGVTTGAGAGGTAGDAGESGEGGEAGAAPVSHCEPGGALFVAGNYGDASRSLLLRTTATAATLALLPKGAVSPAKLPELFLVERSCAPGGALIARDESKHYRIDFSQSDSRLSLCFAPAATLEAALQLAPADKAHAADTGCAGKPFQAFAQEAL